MAKTVVELSQTLRIRNNILECLTRVFNKKLNALALTLSLPLSLSLSLAFFFLCFIYEFFATFSAFLIYFATWNVKPNTHFIFHTHISNLYILRDRSNEWYTHMVNIYALYIVYIYGTIDRFTALERSDPNSSSQSQRPKRSEQREKNLKSE